MRGIYIQKPLEFRVEVPGDRIAQGSPVTCTLSVKNHGETPFSCHDLVLRLALADLKKIKSKAPDARAMLGEAQLERGATIAPGESVSFSWEFLGDKNFPISDKSQSPYLIFGNATEGAALGQQPISVVMHPHYRALFDTFETVFSFINKGESWKDGRTSVKYKAPDIRKLSLVDEMAVSVRFVDDSLEVFYSFKVKKFEAGAQSLNVKRGKAEVTQVWPPSQYLFGDGFIRQEFVDRSIEEALSTVATGF
jgi:hypothetical protein